MIDNVKDDAARMCELLTFYAAELQNEVPVLCRYTDRLMIDGMTSSERERARAWREALTCPSDETTLDSCIASLKEFKNNSTVWGDLQDALCLNDLRGIADALARRRERRSADLDRMIDAANGLRMQYRASDPDAASFAEECGIPYDIAKTINDVIGNDAERDLPDTSERSSLTDAEALAMVNGAAQPSGRKPPMPNKALDFRQWEDSAVRFNAGISDDVAFVEKLIKTRIRAIVSTYNAKVQARAAASTDQGKWPDIIAAGELRLPDGLDEMTARQFALWFNDQIGAIARADIEGMTLSEIIHANKQRLMLTDNLNELKAQTAIGFKMVLDGQEKIIQNQPLTFQQAKAYGSAIGQSTRAKAANKNQIRPPQ